MSMGLNACQPVRIAAPCGHPERLELVRLFGNVLAEAPAGVLDTVSPECLRSIPLSAGQCGVPSGDFAARAVFRSRLTNSQNRPFADIPDRPVQAPEFAAGLYGTTMI